MPSGSQPSASQCDAKLSTGDVTLRELASDLDNDGIPEQLALYQSGERVELRVAGGGSHGEAWCESLPQGAVLTYVDCKDLDSDGRREILLATKGPEANLFSLRVIRWLGARGEFLTPEDASPDRSPVFRSQYYPPWVVDLDHDTSCEIVVAVETSDSRFVGSVVYAWNGQSYHKTDLYLMPPRMKPASPPS